MLRIVKRRDLTVSRGYPHPDRFVFCSVLKCSTLTPNSNKDDLKFQLPNLVPYSVCSVEWFLVILKVVFASVVHGRVIGSVCADFKERHYEGEYIQQDAISVYRVDCSTECRVRWFL